MLEIEALKLSEQELFDKAASHLLRQKQIAVCQFSGKSRCTYENKRDGTRCAVGGVLTGEEIKELRDTQFIKGSPSAFYAGWTTLVDKGIVPATHRWLLNDLQIAHDYFIDRESKYRNGGYVDFAPGLKSIANKYKLDWKFGDA